MPYAKGDRFIYIGETSEFFTSGEVYQIVDYIKEKYHRGKSYVLVLDRDYDAHSWDEDCFQDWFVPKPPLSQEEESKLDSTQYLLVKLAEEASEVAKEALKALQFGLESCNPVDRPDVTNQTRIMEEMEDLITIYQMLQCSKDWSNHTEPAQPTDTARVRKVRKFMEISKALGKFS